MNRPGSPEGSKNIIGERVAELRKANKLSQRALAGKLQLMNLDIDKNTITRIETGKRFVSDFEVKVFADFFGVSYDFLFDGNEG